MVYAAVKGKEEYLQGLSSGGPLETVVEEFNKGLANSDSIEEYLTSKAAPPRFKNVWNAYMSKKLSAEPDRRIVGLMRSEILDLLEKRAVSIYKMCQDLNINKGNAYSYLNHGDNTKVSKAIAASMIEYLEA
ncbi:MAG: hypothetical protein HUJ63_00050 [Enterococcus sp.]|nr:hypothetical protein [Enterococcus sp.]